MLSLERILEITKDMGIKVYDNSQGDHYIFDSEGNKLSFDVSRLKEDEYEKHRELLQFDINGIYPASKEPKLLYSFSKNIGGLDNTLAA